MYYHFKKLIIITIYFLTHRCVWSQDSQPGTDNDFFSVRFRNSKMNGGLIEIPEDELIKLGCNVVLVPRSGHSHTSAEDLNHLRKLIQIFVIWYKDGQIYDPRDEMPAYTMAPISITTNNMNKTNITLSNSTNSTAPNPASIGRKRVFFRSRSALNDELWFGRIKTRDEGSYKCLVVAVDTSKDPEFNSVKLLLGDVPERMSPYQLTHPDWKPFMIERDFRIDVLPLSEFEEEIFVTTPGLFISARNAEAFKSNLILGPPKFIEAESWKYREIVNAAGTRAVIRCPAVANPKPNITWFKNGNLLPIDNERIKKRKWLLILEYLMTFDKGNYTCVVQNEHGSINASFMLDVIEIFPHRPLIIPGYPQNVTVYLGQTAVLNCPLFVDMEVSIHWMKVYHINGSNKNDDGILYAHVIQTSQDQEDPTTLVLTNVTRKDAGQYYCSASNSIGTSKASAWLRVIDALPPPNNNYTVVNGSVSQMQMLLIKAQQKASELVTLETSTFLSRHKWFKSVAFIMSFLLVVSISASLICCRKVKALQKFKHFNTKLFPLFPVGSTTNVTENPFYYHRKIVLEKPVTVERHQETEGIKPPIVRIQYVKNDKETIKQLIKNNVKNSKSQNHSHTKNDNLQSIPLTDSNDMENGRNALYSIPNQKYTDESGLWTDYSMVYDDRWEIPRECLKLGSQIGEGAFGIVFESLLQHEIPPAQSLDHQLDAEERHLNQYPPILFSKQVAVKMLKDNAGDRELADLVSELEVMKIIGHHKNIINLIGCCTSIGGPIYVVVEMASLGNLRDFLRKNRESQYEQVKSTYSPSSNTNTQSTNPESHNTSLCTSEKSVKAKEINQEKQIESTTTPHLSTKNLVNFAVQIAQGMDYLASRKCIHRDLAARNILLTKDGVIKIADFGLARDLAMNDYYKKTTDGRLPVKWMAPESLFDRKYTIKSDVWSFGIVLWEIMTLGGTPYPSLPVEGLFDFLKAGQRLKCPQNCPQEIYGVMMRCWEAFPEARPDFTKLTQILNRILVSTLNVEYQDLGVSLDTPSVCSSTEKQFVFAHHNNTVHFRHHIPNHPTNYNGINYNSTTLHVGHHQQQKHIRNTNNKENSFSYESGRQSQSCHTTSNINSSSPSNERSPTLSEHFSNSPDMKQETEVLPLCQYPSDDTFLHYETGRAIEYALKEYENPKSNPISWKKCCVTSMPPKNIFSNYSNPKNMRYLEYHPHSSLPNPNYSYYQNDNLTN